MAQVRIRSINQRISDEQEVREFLESQEVLYEHWDTHKLPPQLQESFALTEADKALVLATFSKEIDELAQRRGYKIWDVIALSDATPNLNELLTKFEAIHTHTEDEIRAITAGKGIFIIKGDNGIGYFDVELSAGDVISVPENKPHFFTLMDNRAIVAVRLFIESNGWIAEPFDDPTYIKV